MKETINYCLAYYKHLHCWSSIGVFARKREGMIVQVYLCSQCLKVTLQSREEIVRINQ